MESLWKVGKVTYLVYEHNTDHELILDGPPAVATMKVSRLSVIVAISSNVV